MTTPNGAVGRLVVCPTPIGNLGDVTLRVLDENAVASALLWAVKPILGELVDRGCAGVGRMVAYAQSEEHELKLLFGMCNPEDDAKTSGWLRDVALDASR